MTLSVNDVIGVIGAGTMGAGIAQVAAAAGHRVLLFDSVETAAQKGLERTRKGLDRLVERGKITAEKRDGLLARIEPVDSLEALAPARLIVEAVVEDLGVKQDLFARLETICDQSTILATNTSSISVTAIGAPLEKPQRLVGMHFFNPAPVMKLVEVIRGVATDDATASTVHETCTAWSKTPVYARQTPGFIVNRVARPYYGEALKLLQEDAADPVTIDTVLKDCGGFRMGPFELMDLIGIDVNFAVTQSVYETMFNDPKYRPSLVQREMVDAGYLGRKSGRGFYRYDDADKGEGAAAEPHCPPPATVTVRGKLGPGETLVDMLREAGIHIDRYDGKGALKVGETHLALTDGRTATQRSAAEKKPNLVLFDLALDYVTTPRIAIAAGDNTGAEALEPVVGLFQALDKTVTRIDDTPGMIVARTVALLANEAADAVHQRVCTADDLDTAMRLGVNYPRGPLEWADSLKPSRILRIVRNIARSYGDDRYRPSPLLRRVVHSGGRFHGR